MSGLERFALNYAVNSLWQVPLVVIAAWAAARLVRENGPHWEHRVWVGALMLQAGLPLCQLRNAGFAGIARWLGFPAGGGAEGTVRTFLGPAEAAGAGFPIPEVVLRTAILLYAALLMYLAARLAWRLGRTYSVVAKAGSLDAAVLAAMKPQQELEGVRFMTSSAVAGAVTAGIVRSVVIVPPDYLARLAPADRDAMLAHELAHVQRRDFAKNLLYEVLSLPIAYHPAAWLTRTRIAESREMVCDAQAARAASDSQRYARSLLRLAYAQSRQTFTTFHALGIHDAHTLERRVMQLTRVRRQTSIRGGVIALAACVVLTLATSVSALALHVDMATAASSNADRSKPLHVDAGKIAGNRIAGENPVYPPAARAKHVQGTVTLSATISKNGDIEHLEVLSGPDALRVPSLKAVHTWRYRPYLLNGEPVAVQTTINVIYSLGSK